MIRWLIAMSVGLVLTMTVVHAQPTTAQSTEPLERVVRLSPPGQAYIDPEILPVPNTALTTYQTGSGDIFIARLDPVTGLFVSENGRDLLIDSDGARPLETFNGPEFGLSADGWALYYAKPHEDEVQIWQAQPSSDGNFITTPLSSGPRHQTQLVSRNTASATTYIAAIEGTWQDGNAVYFSTDDPAMTYPFEIIENGVSGVRWVDGSFLITYSERQGEQRGQVALLDATTGEAHLITADSGDKTDPYGWYAPDYDGDLLVVAIEDNAAAVVYRDTGGDTFQRIATLTPPADSQFTFVSSAEPFVVGGKSYISLIIKNATSNRDQFTDSEVWIFDINEDPATRYTERCDSGEPGLSRSDPEVLVGTERVFVYYNVLGGDGVTPYEMRRCASNLGADGQPITDPALIDEAAPVLPTAQASDQACVWIEPVATDAAIDVAQEPHYACHEATLPQRDKLLVFFPGTAAIPADYQLFVEEAATMGLHAIGLTYYNPVSLNLDICPTDSDPNCHANIRREVLFGGDHHPSVAISDANTAQNRLVQLLRYLDESDPDGGWEHYLDGDQPRWDQIVVAGHSQGAGMAAFVAHEHAVARAILFSWVDVARGNPAPWIYTPNATPTENYFFFEHVEDRERGEAAKLEMFTLWGVDVFGEENVDTIAPPYNNAHLLLTTITPTRDGPRPSSGAHNVVVVDAYTPMLDDGAAVLAPVWRYLLDVQ